MVILGHGAFTFEDLDGDCVLVISSSGENLGFLGGNNGVARNQFGHDSTDGFDTHGQWVDIQKNDLTSVFFAAQNSGLDSSTVSDSLIRIDTSARLLAVEVLLDQLLNFGNTSRSTNQDDFINIGFLHVGIFNNFLDWFHCGAEEIHVKFFELSTSQSLGEVITFEETFDFDSDLYDL